MSFNASEAFNSPLSIFSSLYQDMNPADLPEGLSPDNQDVWFIPGSVKTRPGLERLLTPIAGAPRILSAADFPLPSGDPIAVFLDSLGALRRRKADGTISLVQQLIAGLQFKSEVAFDKQWYAFFSKDISDDFSDSPFVGADIPKFYDGNRLWRVTSDAPGIPPKFATAQISAATLVTTSSGPSISLLSAVAADPRTSTRHFRDPETGIIETDTITVYLSILFTAATPHGLAFGDSVTIAGYTVDTFLNGSKTVTGVPSPTTFKVFFGSQGYFSLTGGGGSVSQTFPALIRSGNIVTAMTTAAHGFAAGMFVKIADAANAPVYQSLSNITALTGAVRLNGLVTITALSPIANLAVGTLLHVASIADATNFPTGDYSVVAVISPTQFELDWTGADATSGAGTVSEIWTGTFQITAVPSSTSFQYLQLGPDSAYTPATVLTATPQSQVVPGKRNAVLMFKSVNGAITAPSIPVELSAAAGSNFLQALDIPIGPEGTAQRIIALTPAFGSSYYYITPARAPGSTGIISTGTIIQDNTSTSAILDFSDEELVAGTQIDIEGNNLFRQIVLGPCLGVIGYQERLGWWGETNNLKNLINPGFEGGVRYESPASLAGTGANSGTGNGWINPANISDPNFSGSYADVDLAPLQVSKFLLCQGFNFAGIVPGADILSFVVTLRAYFVDHGTGTMTLRLLKAGVPIGAPAVTNISQAISNAGSRLAFSFPLAGSGLTGADLLDPTFGVQIQCAETGGVIGPGNDLAIFLNDVVIQANISDNLPLGWTPPISGIGKLVPQAVPGWAYQMTSTGGPQDAMISQPCAKDFDGAYILIPGRNYKVRLQAFAAIAGTGNLIVEIFSPSLGVISSVSFNVATFSSAFAWQVRTLPALPPTGVPADALLRIYLNAASGTSVVIDDFALIDRDQPVLAQQARVSYVVNPFGYDSITGKIGIESGESLTAAFKQRGYLYPLSDKSQYQTQNNGSTEPDSWTVTKFADQCGCSSPCAVDIGEGVAMWAGRFGHRIFFGDVPKKLSQEVQPTWDRINWDVETRLWLVNDPIERIIYIGLPLDNATAPSIIQPVSYRSVDSAYNVPDPLHVSYSGRMIATDLCRKTTNWNVPAGCGAMLRIGANDEMVFGAGFGNLYRLNFSKRTDDDYGRIASYWVTHGYWGNDIEQNIPQVGTHRKLYSFLSGFVTGVGNLKITPFIDSLGQPTIPLRKYALLEAGQLQHDLEWGTNILGDRTFYKIEPVPFTVAVIQNVALKNGLLIVIAIHDFSPGLQVTLVGLTHATFLNGQTVTITAIGPNVITGLPPGLGAFSAEFAHADYASRPDTGTATPPSLTDAAFDINHLVVAGRMDKVFPIRGAYL